jgi:hypothetical protein
MRELNNGASNKSLAVQYDITEAHVGGIKYTMKKRGILRQA